MSRTHLLIVDDHAVLRAGLRMLINAQPDLSVVGEAGSLAEAMGQAQALQPDVITLDIGLPDGSGIRGIEPLRRVAPKARMLVLTMHDDSAYIRAVIAAGGSGYLIKTAADTELLNAIRSVRGGGLYLNVRLPGESSPLVQRPAASAGGASLSEREVEVLHLLARGFSYQEIAGKLFVSVKTVETYRSRLAGKLGLRKRAELVRYAISTGLLTLDAAPPNEGN